MNTAQIQTQFQGMIVGVSLCEHLSEDEKQYIMDMLTSQMELELQCVEMYADAAMNFE